MFRLISKLSIIGSKNTFRKWARNVKTFQLTFDSFGDPLSVLEFKENSLPDVTGSKVLVKMLASPVYPTDINLISGTSPLLPHLPCVAGEEGVGEVIARGECVSRFQVGNRVIMNSRAGGAWQSLGLYDQQDLHLIPSCLPMPEASMLSRAPAMAYRMLVDYARPNSGETVVQNVANSACGQSVIQLCNAWKYKTLNIVTETENYCGIKDYLLKLGATHVFSDTEAKEGKIEFGGEIQKPVLALNCLGGKDEELILSLLNENGTVIYHGCAFGLRFDQLYNTSELKHRKFLITNWDMCSSCEKFNTINGIVQLILEGKFRAPLHCWVPFPDYKKALEKTPMSEAYGNVNYILNIGSVCRMPF